MYDTGSSLLVAQTRYRRERTNTQNRKSPHNGKNPPSGSHDPEPVIPQTSYHTLTTMGFQLSAIPITACMGPSIREITFRHASKSCSFASMPASSVTGTGGAGRRVGYGDVREIALRAYRDNVGELGEIFSFCCHF